MLGFEAGERLASSSKGEQAKQGEKSLDKTQKLGDSPQQEMQESSTTMESPPQRDLSSIELKMSPRTRRNKEKKYKTPPLASTSNSPRSNEKRSRSCSTDKKVDSSDSEKKRDSPALTSMISEDESQHSSPRKSRAKKEGSGHSRHSTGGMSSGNVTPTNCPLLGSGDKVRDRKHRRSRSQDPKEQKEVEDLLLARRNDPHNVGSSKSSTTPSAIAAVFFFPTSSQSSPNLNPPRRGRTSEQGKCSPSTHKKVRKSRSRSRSGSKHKKRTVHTSSEQEEEKTEDESSVSKDIPDTPNNKPTTTPPTSIEDWRRAHQKKLLEKHKNAVRQQHQ